MTDLKISELGDAGTLTGSELVEVVQSSTNKKSTLNDVKDFCAPDLRQYASNALTMVIFGDSRTYHNLQSIDITNGNYRLRDNGYFNWANALAGSPFRLVSNAGISGNTTTQMLARVTTDVCNVDADFCVMFGGTNDSVNVPVTFANLTSCAEAIVASGKYCFIVGEVPKTFSSAAHFVALNTLLKQWCANQKRIEFVDAWAETIDATSTTNQPKTDVFYDGLHFSTFGALCVGRALAKHFERFRYRAKPLVSGLSDCYGNNANSSNIWDYPVMTGTGGTAGTGASGTIPDGWNVFRASGAGTAICETVARDDGCGNNLRLTISTPSSGTFTVQGIDSVHSRLTVGNYTFADCEINVINPVNMRQSSMKVTGNTTEISCLTKMGAYGVYDAGFETVRRTPEMFQVPSGGQTSFVPSMSFEFVGAGSAVIEIGRFGIWSIA